MSYSAHPPSQTIAVTRIGDVTAITFLGAEIRDSDQIQVQFEEVDRLVRGEKKALINFVNVSYLSSLGLRMLLRINKKIKENDGRLHLCCLQSNVSDVFKIAKLDRVFAIYPDEESALADF